MSPFSSTDCLRARSCESNLAGEPHSSTLVRSHVLTAVAEPCPSVVVGSREQQHDDLLLLVYTVLDHYY